MCGLAGIIGAPGVVHAADTMPLMLRSLERRGPDSGGTAAWPDAVLGHRRLAIFDLSAAGHQPMLSPDGQIGVVFNGAIYNFRELRGGLARDGVAFRSETDTEVLIHGYRLWGIDALVARLHGMFAFGLWDNTARRLFLVRDRLGVKPLVYVEGNGTIAFASTVRALRSGGFAERLSPQAVADFLQHGFITEGRSIYDGVSKLPPASIAEWGGGKFAIHRYWSPPS